MFNDYDSDICGNRHGGSETSEAAFEQIRGSLPKARQAVLDIIAASGSRGLTAQQIADIMNVSVNTISGRVSELLRSGDVFDTGERRPTASGCKARVVAALGAIETQTEFLN